jgi:hypothetical protein
MPTTPDRVDDAPRPGAQGVPVEKLVALRQRLAAALG